MKRSELVLALTSIIRSDRQVWRTDAIERALAVALLELSKHRPLVNEGSVTLQASKAIYGLPDCVTHYIGSDWGISDLRTQPWETDYAFSAPRVTVVQALSGLALHFTPAPTARDMQRHGAIFDYYYGASHILTEEDCSVLAPDLELLKLGCLRALIRELVASNITDPITLHKGLGSVPANSTPAATLLLLDDQYQQMVKP